MRVIALIPARGGSVRIPGKNIKPLGGRPLLHYTLAAAVQSGVFVRILVSSDDDATLACAQEIPGVMTVRRPAKLATAESPDVEWVAHALAYVAGDRPYDAFAILRPTSPFRTADTIRRAWVAFDGSGCDSLRAIEPVRETPYKMWVGTSADMRPLLSMGEHPPWHSRPTQTLPVVYKQNASLEIAKCALVQDRLYPSITGPCVYGFLNPEPDGFDLNTLEDWDRAEAMIASGAWTLPTL